MTSRLELDCTMSKVVQRVKTFSGFILVTMAWIGPSLQIKRSIFLLEWYVFFISS
jgi:hypothetical protein